MPDGERTRMLDVAIVGGGIAALWTLDALDEAGYAAALLEPRALGEGQTLAAQGIIHGGLKYSLQGLVAPAAQAIRAMPERWRRSLAGATRPDLSGVRIASDATWLWRPQGVVGAFSILGAKLALRTRPVEVPLADRPELLRSIPATVYRVDEPVLDTRSLVERLRDLHASRMTAAPGLTIAREGDRFVLASDGRAWSARRVVLAAGQGNALYREALRLPHRMQRRPLRMGLLRGSIDRPLPELFGHCVDRGAPRLTITAHRDASAGTVWQLGGQLAEDGLRHEGDDFLAVARSELERALPGARERGLELDRLEWSSYDVDRAELATAGRARPDDAQCLAEEDGSITLWPTKLALAPRAAELVLEHLAATRAPRSGSRPLDARTRPEIGAAPWERVVWRRLPAEARR